MLASLKCLPINEHRQLPTTEGCTPRPCYFLGYDTPESAEQLSPRKLEFLVYLLGRRSAYRAFTFCCSLLVISTRAPGRQSPIITRHWQLMFFALSDYVDLPTYPLYSIPLNA